MQPTNAIQREEILRVRHRLHRSMSTSVQPVLVWDQATRGAHKDVPTDEDPKAVMDRRHHPRMERRRN